MGSLFTPLFLTVTISNPSGNSVGSNFNYIQNLTTSSATTLIQTMIIFHPGNYNNILTSLSASTPAPIEQSNWSFWKVSPVTSLLWKTLRRPTSQTTYNANEANEALLHLSLCHSDLISNHCPNCSPRFIQAGLLALPLASQVSFTSELCTGCSLCLKCHPPNVHLANSLTSFRSLLNCVLLNEALYYHLI